MSSFGRAGLAVFVIAILSCGGSITEPIPPVVPVLTTVTVAPSASSLVVGGTQQLTATTLDATGATLTGRTITWTTSDATKATVSSTGLVTAVAVGTATITATSEGKSGTSAVTVTVAAATQIAINGGNNQTATAGSAVNTRPSVIVKDANGNPVSGITVTFAVATGGGSATTLTPSTNASGIASVGSWTLGTTAGVNTMTAAAAGLVGSPVTFSDTSTLFAAKLVFAQQPTRVLHGRTFIPLIVIQTSDAQGNPVSTGSSTITLALQTATGAAGTFSGTATQASNGGVATFGGLAPTTDGDNMRLVASAPGLISATSDPFKVDPAVVLIDSTVFHLVSDSTTRAGGTYVFQLNGTGPAGLDSGKVIAGAEQGGFLRRITHVDRNGSTVQLQTVAASLDEIVQNDSLVVRPSFPANAREFSTQSRLSPGSAPRFTAANPAISGALNDFTITNLVLSGTAGDGLILQSGHLTFSLSPTLIAKYGGLFQPPKSVRFAIEGKSTFDANLILGASAQIERKNSVPLGTVEFPPELHIVGGVPLYVTFSIPITIEWSLEVGAQAGLALGWLSTATITSGVVWSPASGFSPIAENTFEFTPQFPTPTIAAQSTVHLGLQAKLDVRVNLVAGGSIWAQPFAEGTVSLDLLNNQYTTSCHSAIEVGAGVDLTILGHTLGLFEKTIDILDTPWLACAHTGQLVPTVPTIALSSSTVAFAATTGSSSPATKSIGVTNGGTGTLDGLSSSVSYSAGQPHGWLAATPSTTTAPANINLVPTTNSLPAGSYSATVWVQSTASSVTNSPQPIAVNLVVSDPVVAVASVSVSPSTATVAIGGTQQFTPTLKDASGNTLTNRSVIWTSGTQSVATINSSTGVATGVAVGTTYITAYSEGKTSNAATLTVTVSGPTAAQSTLQLSATSVAAGGTLTATVTLKNASGQIVTTAAASAFSTATPSVGTLGSWSCTLGVCTATYTAPPTTGSTSIGVTIGGTNVSGSPATITVMAVATSPDLQALNGAVSPASVSAGGSVTATWTLANPGTGPSNPSTTVLRVNQSATSAAGSNLFTFSTASLAASGTVAQGATITASTTPGTYHVWVLLDNTGSAGQNSSATANDIVHIGSFTVTAVPAAVATVTVAPATASILVGATQQFTPTLKDASGNTLTGRTVTWSSGTVSVATINSSTGVATAVAAGTATITATSEGKTGTATITVTAVPAAVATVTVAPVTASILVGGTQQFSTTLKDASGNILTNRSVTWSSSNTAVATVNSSSGIATGVAVGTATIAASSEGRTGTATLTVVALTAQGVTTDPADGVTASSARLLGSVAQNGSAYTVWFEFGQSPTLASPTLTGIGSAPDSNCPGTTTCHWSGVLTGLTSNTTYYFRLVINDAAGTTRGAIRSFTTASPPVISNLTRTLVTLNSASCNMRDNSGVVGSLFRTSFTFTDPDGDVSTAGSPVTDTWVFMPGNATGTMLPVVSLSSGNGASGTMTFDDCSRFDATTSVMSTVVLRDSAGNVSNALSVTVLKPEGANSAEPLRSGAMSAPVPPGR